MHRQARLQSPDHQTDDPSKPKGGLTSVLIEASFDRTPLGPRLRGDDAELIDALSCTSVKLNKCMLQIAKNVIWYRELIAVMAWKQIIVRYKQSYLGLVWAVLKPFTLMLVFTLLNSFIGISTGNIPYPVLAFTALIPWVFFQESTSEGVGSIVNNAQLIRKIYFPREVFPITGVITKLVEFVINSFVLGCLMLYFNVAPASTIVWVPALLLYIDPRLARGRAHRCGTQRFLP